MEEDTSIPKQKKRDFSGVAVSKEEHFFFWEAEQKVVFRMYPCPRTPRRETSCFTARRRPRWWRLSRLCRRKGRSRPEELSHDSPNIRG